MPFCLVTYVPSAITVQTWFGLVFSVVLLHNGGYCNGCVTKRCLQKSTNVSYTDLVYDRSMITDEHNKNSTCNVFSFSE